MRAVVTFIHAVDGAEVIEVNGHRLQFGHGSGGDGYCYGHQSFDCLDNLTEAEREALKTPDYEVDL